LKIKKEIIDESRRFYMNAVYLNEIKNKMNNVLMRKRCSENDLRDYLKLKQNLKNICVNLNLAEKETFHAKALISKGYSVNSKPGDNGKLIELNSQINQIYKDLDKTLNEIDHKMSELNLTINSLDSQYRRLESEYKAAVGGLVV
jgi:chaperonin cofactor prefoldin